MSSKKKPATVSGKPSSKPARSKKPAPAPPTDAAPLGDVGPGAATAEVAAVGATPKPTRRAGGRGTSGKVPKAPKPLKPKRLSGLDAAAQVLAEAKAPMSVTEIFQRIEAKGLWRTSGKTPTATLYAAIVREISAKKHDSRFKKTERGRFAATGVEG